MRRVVAALVVLTLMAAPAAAADIYHTPFIPDPPPAPTAGSVILQLSVFDGLTWATDQTLILADPTLTVDCGEQPAGGV